MGGLNFGVVGNDINNCNISFNGGDGIFDYNGARSEKDKELFWRHISNTIFEGNAGNGYWKGASVIELTNCIFKNNAGYGVYCGYDGGSFVKFDSCFFSSNNAGGFFNYGEMNDFSDCVFESNSGGSAVHAAYDIHRMINCTFTNNSSTSSAVINTWHHPNSLDTILISNCLIANNKSLGAISCFSSSSPAILDISCTNIFNNAGGDWTDSLAQFQIINGNLSTDPLFCDTSSSDFTIRSTSVCAPANNSCGELIGAGGVGCYELANFHLLNPASDSIFIAMPNPFDWSKSREVYLNQDATYRIFIDTDSTFISPDSSEILADTTYWLSEELARANRYYWKVLATIPEAPPKWSLETGNFYLDGYPTQPVIFAPVSGVGANSATVFSWYISTDPDSFDSVSYTIQIDNDSLFSSPEINQIGLRSDTVVDDAFAIRLGELEGFSNLQIDTRYFWRVRAVDNYGLSSDWADGSNWFVFMPQNQAPYAPDSGFFPANGEEVISLRPVITWNDAYDPDGNSDNLMYAIRLSQDSLFTGLVYIDTTEFGINQIQPTADLIDNAHYFYQIKAIDYSGLSSGWSETQNFWTNHYNFPPEPFPLFGLPNGTRIVDYYSSFSWGSTVDYDPNSSFTFSIETSNDSLFRDVFWSRNGLNDTSLTIATDSLINVGPLYWRVLATDNDSLVRIGGIPEGFKNLMILPPGDANSNGVTNGIDVTFMVNYLKGLGPAPDPLLAGDANGNCSTNGIDVTYLVNYLKGLGGAPARGSCENQKSSKK